MTKKNYFRIIILMAFIGLMSASLAGCGLFERQLDTPIKLQVSDTYLLSWSAVDNAVDYTVNIDGEEHISNSSSFQIPESDTRDIGAYTVKVKANAGSGYKTSKYCTQVSFYVVGALDAPTGLATNLESEILSWNIVQNAISYIVNIGEKEFKTEENKFELANISTAGIFHISVKAVGDSKPYADSVFSQSIDCTLVRKLATPDIETIRLEQSKIVWASVPHAIRYEVEIASGLITVDTNSLSIYIEQLEEAKTYEIKIRAIGDAEFYLDSEFSSKYSYVQPERLARPLTSGVNLKTRLATWDAVSGAISYEFVIERTNYNSSYITKATSYSLKNVTVTGEFTIKVRALGVEGESRNSVFTNGFDLILGYELSVPTRVSYNVANNLLTWSGDSHADAYIILIDGVEYESKQPFFDISSVVKELRVYDVYVRAVSDNIIYFDSNYSALIQCTLWINLSTPTNIRIDEEGKNLVWDADPYASQFYLNYYDSATTTIFQQITVFGNSISLTEFESTGTYFIEIVASGGQYTRSSEMSEKYEVFILAALKTGRISIISKGVFMLNTVENAVGYAVNLNGIDYVITDEFAVDDSGRIIIDFSVNFTFLESGSYSMTYKAIGDGINFRDSAYSSSITFGL